LFSLLFFITYLRCVPVQRFSGFTEIKNMNKLQIQMQRLLFAMIVFPLFFSCANLPQKRPPERPPERPEVSTLPEASPEHTAAATLPEASPEHTAAALPQAIPERLEPSEYIMGKGRITGEKLALFLEQHNPLADRGFVQALADFYIDEAAAEGVNHDTAFSQMCLETGFLSYGNLVQPEQNNFCGLGAIGPGQPGETFPDPRIGVRAHIQHLKAYATEEPLNGPLVDPRYKWVRLGSSPTIHGLSGTWAADKTYSSKIANILQRLYYGVVPE
jgi:hypothetical protein